MDKIVTVNIKKIKNKKGKRKKKKKIRLDSQANLRVLVKSITTTN